MAHLVTLDGSPSVTPGAASSGGVPNNFRIASAAATNNASVVKVLQGQVYWVIAYNATTTTRFLKFYNKGTTPNPAVDTPVLVIPIPAGGGVWGDTHIGANLFPNGMSIAIVQGAADNDNTACVAGDVVGINVGYA